MPKRLAAILGFVLAVGIAVVGCNADRSPLAPPQSTTTLQAAPAPSRGLLGGLLGGLVKLVNVAVSVLQRGTPLQNDVVWSFYAGPSGASSGNRTVGLSILVPPGALDRTVKITVTARKGSVIDYHFEPEGLQFAKPVVLTQDISDKSVLGLASLLGSKKTFKGAYYSAPVLQYDPKTGTAVVNEFQPTVTYPGYVTFQIRHFSGYVVASCDNDSWF